MLASVHTIKWTFSYTVEKNAMETNFPNSNLEISTKSFCPVIILLQIYSKKIITDMDRDLCNNDLKDECYGFLFDFSKIMVKNS